METKFTPGPWSVGRADADRYGYTPINADKWEWLAQVATRLDRVESCEGIANARLIAAAPELLEACQSALDMCAEGGNPKETIALLQAAIAKATIATSKAGE